MNTNKSREQEKQDIIKTFSAKMSSYCMSIITGEPNTGKTTMLTEIADYFRGKQGWMVVNLSSERDLFQSLIEYFMNQDDIVSIFEDEINNYAYYKSVIKSINTISEVYTAIILEHIFKALSNHNIRTLITIDNAVCNKTMVQFISQYQIYLGYDFEIYFLIAGLSENIQELLDYETITFIYRAPRVVLSQLDWDNTKINS